MIPKCDLCLLERETYRPQPVRRVEIDKAGAGKRKLGVPTVIDRAIQQAILQVIEPLFEAEFSDSSFGYRPGRRAQDGVMRVRELRQNGLCYAVDMDIEKFSDRVNQDRLINRVAKRVADKRISRLINRFPRAGVREAGGDISPTRQGVAQGGPISSLLANIVLDELDKELEKRGLSFVRYADDILILTGSGVQERE